MLMLDASSLELREPLGRLFEYLVIVPSLYRMAGALALVGTFGG